MTEVNARSAGKAAALAIDIGGTFTDVVLVGPDGRLHRAKTLTTPHDPVEGLVAGVVTVLAESGVDPRAVTRVVHATTLATNAVLERRGARIAYITTQGFRTMLSLGHYARVEDERYDLFFNAPEPPVPLSHSFEVAERVSATGEILVSMDEEAAERIIGQIRDLDVASVAICLLHSYANPVHERRLAELCRVSLPGIVVVASSETWPEIREHERASTTVVSAYVGPVMATYLTALEGRLAELGIVAPVQIMESSGGVMSAAQAAAKAVYTIESGPAAGVVAAAYVGKSCGRSQLISFDMGGTTAKAGLIRDGQPEITHDFSVGGKGNFGGRRHGSGIPIKVPAIDLAEVGAGGGSIAWVDDGGALRVGPRSAGADPGPACYGHGGQEPTVTDANLLLGYLDPGTFARGTMKLRPDLSEVAIAQRIGAAIGLEVAEAALAIHEIVNSNMAAAVDVVTVQRGVDPRHFVLVASGGAGPMHIARIADHFGIETVLVPAASGVASAIGLLATDLSAERAQTCLTAGTEPAVLNRLLAQLTDNTLSDLGVDRGHPDVTVANFVDIRFVGQAHQLTVAAPSTFDSVEDVEAVGREFFREYERAYGIRLAAPTEFVNLRVRVNQQVPRLASADPDDERAGRGSARKGTRRAYFTELGGFTEVPVFERERLFIGDSFEGPAIIEEPEATLVVPPGWAGEIDPFHNILMRRRVATGSPNGITGPELTMANAPASTDAAAREILRNALAVAAEEASIVVVKAAYSTFVVEGADAAAAILDSKGQLVAQSVATTLAHSASIRCSLLSVLEDYPADQMAPGDVYAMNDVFRGGIHANDVVIVRPVFVGGRPRFFTASVIHVADLGGESAGGIAAATTEVYGEGLQLPPVRIATAAGMDNEICRILALNSRAPESMLGDVRALMAGCNVAARRLEALIEQSGPDEFVARVDDHLDYTETRMRNGLAALPDGTYRGEFTIDDDGRRPDTPLHVRVAVTIEGDHAIVDFEGTDAQVDSAINCGYSQATSGVMFALRCYLDPTIPMNEGCFRPVDIRLPHGSLVNPTSPHPAGGRNFVMSACIDAVIQGLASAVTDRAVAASGIVHSFSMSAARPGSHPWIHMSYEYSGHGARRGSDGPDATGMHFGLARNTIPQVEPLEAQTPFVVEAKEFIPDSGGAGRWRGGLGCRTIIRLLEDATVTYRGDRMVFPPPGRDGGGAGRPGGYFRRDRDGQKTRLANKALGVALAAGEAFIVETSGGGGLGPASARDPAAVARDVADGRITRDAAVADYGRYDAAEMNSSQAERRAASTNSTRGRSGLRI